MASAARRDPVPGAGVGTAQAWYSEDRRAAAWQRKTADEAEAVFATLGLTGAFWQLRS